MKGTKSTGRLNEPKRMLLAGVSALTLLVGGSVPAQADPVSLSIERQTLPPTMVRGEDITVPPSHLLIAFALLTVVILITPMVARTAHRVVARTAHRVIYETRAAISLKEKVEAAPWMPAKVQKGLASSLVKFHEACSPTANKEVSR